jgi:iron(III) transport system permease protein
MSKENITTETKQKDNVSAAVIDEKQQLKENRRRAKQSQRQSRILDTKKLLKEPFTVMSILLLFVFLFFFVAYPLLILFANGFTISKKMDVGRANVFSWDNFGYIFNQLYFGEAIKNSLIIGLLVAVGAVLVGFLFAYVEVYVHFRSKLITVLFKIVSLLPTISPPFLVAIAIILLFGNNGLITNGLFNKGTSASLFGVPGVVIVEIITFFPTAYLMLRALLKNIDPSLEEAARDMGASRWKVFWTVTFPLLLPGIGNAFLVSFIESIADFANPFIIGGSVDTMSTTIYTSYMGGNGVNGPHRAAAMALILLAISMFFYFIQKYCLEKKTYATLSGKATRARIMIEDRSVVVPLGIFCGLISFFVISLYILVFLCSFWRNLDVKNLVWTTANWTEIGSKMFTGSSSSLWNTVWTSAVAAVITAAVSMLVAFLVVKKRFPGKGVLEFVAMLAMAVPGTVLGIGFVRGFVGGFFETGFLKFLYGTMAIIVIIFIVRSLPIGIRSGVGALRQIDKSIEESAADMGAGSGKIFTTVTVPLIKDSLFSSLVTSFVRSMTAISAIIVVSTPGTTLITYEMNELGDKGAYEQAAVYATVMILIAGAAVGLMDLFIHFFGTSRVRKPKQPKAEKGAK